jgi:hypothetical protein
MKLDQIARSDESSRGIDRWTTDMKAPNTSRDDETSSKRRGRIVLNDDLAIEIYKHKDLLCRRRTYSSVFMAPEALLRGQSAVVSKIYGVSAKTIRDIWNHKTWVDATLHLWDPMTSIGQVAAQHPSGKPSSSIGTHAKLIAEVAISDTRPQVLIPNLFSPNRSMLVEPPNLLPARPATVLAWDSPRACSAAHQPSPLSNSISTADALRLDPSSFNDPFRSDWPHWDATASFVPRDVPGLVPAANQTTQAPRRCPAGWTFFPN